MASTTADSVPIRGDEKMVIFASSLGTVFEWYDFYLFGVMSAIIAAGLSGRGGSSSIFSTRRRCAAVDLRSRCSNVAATRLWDASDRTSHA
mgnify:CR=1 FL=1